MWYVVECERYECCVPVMRTQRVVAVVVGVPSGLQADSISDRISLIRDTEQMMKQIK